MTLRIVRVTSEVSTNEMKVEHFFSSAAADSSSTTHRCPSMHILSVSVRLSFSSGGVRTLTVEQRVESEVDFAVVRVNSTSVYRCTFVPYAAS